jgi:hypothetical protein
MTEPARGLRAVPLPLIAAMVLWVGFAIARPLVALADADALFSPRMQALAEGVGLAAYVLATIGMLDLARALPGRAAVGARIAAIATACGLGCDVAMGLLNFKPEWLAERWISDVYRYVFAATWLAIPAGLAIAVWPVRRGLAIGACVVAVLTGPPPALYDVLYGWLELDVWSWSVRGAVLRVGRVGVVLVLAASVARPLALTDHHRAAEKLRAVSRALWLRVIAAVGLVVLTLLMIASRGGQGALEVMRLAMLTAAIINLLALVKLGLGALGAARFGGGELPRIPLVLASAASLWSAGVALAQLPFAFQLLYGDGGLWGRGYLQERVETFSVVVPVVVTLGIALVAVAIAGFAARRGLDELRARAHGKGIGFVALVGVSLAIQAWMLPEAGSLGALAMLSILGALAALGATVMIARLFGEAAVEIERDAQLPRATAR